MQILNWKRFNEELVGYVAISDFQSYIDGMSTTYVDKLFFLNIIDPDVVVDFGCANGLILSKIKEARPNIKLIGYDLDETMLDQARNLLGEKALLTDSWQEVQNELKKFKKPALVLSSVIHEVYSYSNSMTIKKFWDAQVFGGDFKWIAIRDMLPSVEIHKQDISKFRNDVEKVRDLADPKYLDSFENIWGTIDDNYRTFTHYLLKYRFTDNWDREVKENYLPVSLETIYKKLPSDYKIIYETNFILPYLQQKVKEDFDIELKQTTHTKMVIVNTSFRKTNEAIIDYRSDDIKSFYDELSQILSNTGQYGRLRNEVMFNQVVEVGRKHDIDVVDYRTFYNDLPEQDKLTAPPQNAPVFALVNPVNHKPRVVINVPSIDKRMLDHIYHMLKHENIHVGQIARKKVQNQRMVNPTDRKSYFSDKDEIMAFSQSIVDMLMSEHNIQNYTQLKSRLKYNRLYSEIKRSVDEKTLNRYHKYIYLYFEKELENKNQVNELFGLFSKKDDDIAKGILRKLSTSEPIIHKDDFTEDHFDNGNRYMFELESVNIELINVWYTSRSREIGPTTVEKFYLKVDGVDLECSSSILRKMTKVLDKKIEAPKKEVEEFIKKDIRNIFKK